MPAICIHGHFYQPPREDPLTGRIPRQPSAAPYPDWNHRITEECYRPCAAAAVLSDEGEVAARESVYRHISFDFGPTLLRWLARNAPDVHDAVIGADRASLHAHGGHGNALAHGYHHAILPLCDDRDRRTEVRWGVADFRRRFGRDPEGFWLPECAVDTPTLLTLAEEGIRFVVLAPGQAALDDGRTVDTTRAHRIDLPGGTCIAAFFYDGGAAHGVAFDGWLHDGDAMAERLAARAAAAGPGGLVHLATDGESYGHHHRHGEMALAWCIRRLRDDLGLPLTNYGQWLAEHPPAAAIRIAERTAWSCAHGLRRWSDDCSCGVDPSPEPGRTMTPWGRLRSGHAWRGVLRRALDALRDGIDAYYEAEMRRHGEDPWAARDAHIEAILDSEPALGPARARPPGRPADRAVPALLELARARLMMFTSCGWFFDDPRGIETTQLLRYAALAADRAADLGGPSLRPDLERALAAGGMSLP